VKLWIAQGFGVGRIPIAPGTFGSVLGVAWFALLLMSGSAWGLAIGAFLGLALSVWLCGFGERVLATKDPSSVVLDEIAAMPVCFFAWIAIVLGQGGALPNPSYFISKQHWAWTVGVFAAFRLFDVTKPWPVRQSQSLPAGWGITIDDFLAALYVNLVTLVAYKGKLLLGNGG
jgi:phosphatidylglycerophosphatase A